MTTMRQIIDEAINGNQNQMVLFYKDRMTVRFDLNHTSRGHLDYSLSFQWKDDPKPVTVQVTNTDIATLKNDLNHFGYLINQEFDDFEGGSW